MTCTNFIAVTLTLISVTSQTAAHEEVGQQRPPSFRSVAAGPTPNLSAVHQRMFCGDQDGELSGAYARAVLAEVKALSPGRQPNVGAALSKMRATYCGEKSTRETEQ